MTRFRRKCWGGLQVALLMGGLLVAQAESADNTTTASDTTNQNSEYQADDAYQTDKKHQLSERQAGELDDIVKNMITHIVEAKKGFNQNNYAIAENKIADAQASFNQLKQKAGSFGLVTVESEGGFWASIKGWFGGSDDNVELATIRIPVYTGNQLVSLTRIISTARNQEHYASDLQSSGTTYGRGDMSDDRNTYGDTDTVKSTYGQDDMSDGRDTYGNTDTTSSAYGHDNDTYGKADTMSSTYGHDNDTYGNTDTMSSTYGHDNDTYGKADTMSSTYGHGNDIYGKADTMSSTYGRGNMSDTSGTYGNADTMSSTDEDRKSDVSGTYGQSDTMASTPGHGNMSDTSGAYGESDTLSSTYGRGEMSGEGEISYDIRDSATVGSEHSDTMASMYDHSELLDEGLLTYEGSDSMGAANKLPSWRNMTDEPSVIVVDLEEVDEKLAEAKEALKKREYDEAREALNEIQMDAVSLEYSPVHEPLSRIGEAFAKAKTAVDARRYDEAESALQEVDSELTEFKNEASGTMRYQINRVQLDIQRWSKQIRQDASQADDKFEDWWGQMSRWFDNNTAI